MNNDIFIFDESGTILKGVNDKSIRNVRIPDGVTSIGDYAFCECTGLISVTIPDSVTCIGDHAFSRCSNLTSINIPNSVISIGLDAFQDCTNLTSITIPDSVARIGNGAFRGCSGLTNINVNLSNRTYDSRGKCNAIIESSTNTLIAGCINTTIPDSVTIIGDFAFSGCSRLSTITIPNSVTSIGGCAFGSCFDLTSIDIPNSVTSIGWCAFEFCTSLASLIIGTGVKTIGNYAFLNCSKLDTDLPNGVESIGDNAFNGCTSITSINIPASLISIGNDVFSGSSISKIEVNNNAVYFSEDGVLYKRMPNGCNMLVRFPPRKSCNGDNAFFQVRKDTTIIDNCAFRDCFLTGVTFHKNIEEIGKEAFAGCSLLNKITLPNSSRYTIRYRAFSGCNKKGVIHSPSEDINGLVIDDNAFDENILKNWILYIPKNTLGAYKHHPVFGKFKNITDEKPKSFIDKIFS